jgi:peptide deformylase
MAKLEIVHYPAEILKATAEPVSDFGKSLRDLATDMFETMYEFDGVGLAAPQIGLSIRMIVVDSRLAPEERLVIVNPRITGRQGEELGLEGCLSLPDLFAEVVRSARISVTAADCDGNPVSFDASGFLARIIQHEIDHLDGKVFVDRLDPFEKDVKLTEYEASRAAMADRVDEG